MLRKLALSLVLALGLVALPAVAHAADCSDQSQLTGGCGSGEILGPDVVLSVTEETEYDTEGDTGAPSGPRGTTCEFIVNDRCASRNPHGTLEATNVVISLSDIAHFRPHPPIDAMEPNGWAIIGLDTNFYSTGGAEVVEGALLGQPASVRFTPVSWRWTYGDGTSSVASTRGGSWASQGILEFDATPTSHVYRQPGTYLIDLSVDFRAEYRFGAGAWTRIPGILSVPANQLEAAAGDAKTVLVADDCTANPRGSGC